VASVRIEQLRYFVATVEAGTMTARREARDASGHARRA
jgi:hypothetical protein